MKITVSRLKTIIKEEVAALKGVSETRYYKRDSDAPEESPKEELGSEAHACAAEQTDNVLGDLKKILEHWEEAEYESDEARWQEYAKDVQSMIDQYEGEEEPAEHTEEEWKEEKGKKEKKSKPKKPGKKKAPSEKKEGVATPKAKTPKLTKMTYESKKSEKGVYKKLMTALGDKK